MALWEVLLLRKDSDGAICCLSMIAKRDRCKCGFLDFSGNFKKGTGFFIRQPGFLG